MGIRDVDNYTDCPTGGPTFNACDLHFKKMMPLLLYFFPCWAQTKKVSKPKNLKIREIKLRKLLGARIGSDLKLDKYVLQVNL